MEKGRQVINASRKDGLSLLMGDWKKAFICERVRVADGWDNIQVELANVLECRIILNAISVK